MEMYVMAQRWESSLVDSLLQHTTGVIIGDPFCQKRMFEHDEYDALELAEYAKSLGLMVVFQSPVYNTVRTFESTLSLLKKLHKNGHVDAVFVHDIGVLAKLQEFSGLELWWDRFAFNRDIVPNRQLVLFLRQQGISRIEATRAADIDDIYAAGCGVQFYGYGPEIASFGRVCYTERFLDEPCERKILCRSKDPFIVSKDKVPLQYLADGYTLLDRKEPVHLMPKLDSSQRGKISGLTVIIRSSVDIEVIDRMQAMFPTHQQP